jgi:dipeptidyl aminopeptidase/acylaminoacyl peptidase
LIVACSITSDAAAASLAARPVAPAPALDLLRAEVEATKIRYETRNAISTDGRWLAYVTARGQVSTNETVVEVRLRDLREGGERLLVQRSTKGRAVWVTPEFSPDSRRLALLDAAKPHEISIYDLPQASVRPLRLAPAEAGSIQALHWAPDSARIGLVVQPPVSPDDLLTGVSVSADWSWRMGLKAEAGAKLVVVNAGDGRILSTSPDNLSVDDFDWAPSGELVALSGTPVVPQGQVGADLAQYAETVFLLDLATGKVQPVAKPYAVRPKFSPDGHRLAFSTAVDGDVYKPGEIGVYDVATGRLRRFGAAWNRSLQSLAWRDNRHLIGWSYEGVGCAIRDVDVDRETTRLLGTPGLACERAPLVAPSRGEVAFVRDEFLGLADIWISPLEVWRPLRVTSLNEALNAKLRETADVRLITWPSRDGAFRIPGLLFTPKDDRRPSPLVVSVAGGPGVVNALIMGEAEGQHLTLPTVAAGYSVLMPVTRGRGGFDRAFSDAIRSRGDYVAGPLSDVMEGVQLAENLGAAIPGERAIMGFSYGAILGAYAVGQGDAFKAAVLGDPGGVDFVNDAYRSAAGYGSHVQMSIMGVGSPYDPEALASLRAQSPVTYADRVRTPTLMECGALSGAAQQGCPIFFLGLQHAGVPSELIMFPRTGHGVFEPSLLYDSERRRLEWLARWLPAS